MRKLKAKMGFFDLAKHGLNKHGFKRSKLVSFWGRKKNVKRKKKKRRRGRGDQASQGMELWILYGSHGILRLVMVNSLFPKLGF